MRGMILLAVKDLWRGFDEDPILRGLNFEIRRGQRIGLVGPNGCGKTTLLNLIGGLDCLLYTSPSPRDGLLSRMPASA